MCSTGVMHGEYSHPIRGLYVGEHPEGSHVDAVSVYCSSCGSWLGWRIVRIYIFNKLINFLLDLFDIKIDNHGTYVTDSAACLPPCNP